MGLGAKGHAAKKSGIVGAMRFCLGVVSFLLAACATQREQRLSSADARDRPSDEACEAKGKPSVAGAHWACGYWHWDGVRYVWVDGRWQAPPP
jgi:hypothetical protein